MQFSAGDLEMVEIPDDIEAFHNGILVDMAEPALGVEFCEAWKGSGERRLNTTSVSDTKAHSSLGDRTGMTTWS